MSSPDERRMYDWSLAREGNAEKFIWPYEVDVSELQKGDPPPQVLYFFLFLNISNCLCEVLADTKIDFHF